MAPFEDCWEVRFSDLRLLGAISSEIVKFWHIYGVHQHMSHIEDCLKLIVPWIKNKNSVQSVTENLAGFSRGFEECGMGESNFEGC